MFVGCFWQNSTVAKDQVSEEQKESIRTMLGAGNGVRKIAKTIGCLRQVVKNERKAAEAEENNKKAEKYGGDTADGQNHK